MKQLDFETSSYKFKEEVKTYVTGFNDLTEKYLKSFENSDADFKKVVGNIEKKNATIEKLESSLVDFNNRTDELKALKELSNVEIKSLEAKKAEISYTDSEVQKMEVDDINSQISSKKGKISKIDAKLESTKAKIKSSTDEKKVQEKQLKELEKQKKTEEEALFKTEAILNLINETKTAFNDKILEIINSTYKPEKTSEVEVSEPVAKVSKAPKEQKEKKKDQEASTPILDGVASFGITEEDLSVLDYIDETPNMDADIHFPTLETELKAKTDVKQEEKKQEPSKLEKALSKESLNFDDFNKKAKEKMLAKEDVAIANLEVLKKHNVPLEYVVDQSEILYDISTQDLDDLLSIITTDSDGNGMGFTIDFVYNILSELSKINVDKLIDVYNEEFMNINSKSGIINLLKLTNPSLTNFAKNRSINIETLKSIGTATVDEIVKKYPEFIDMDTPLFLQVLNVFDRSDLVDKLNSDIDVIPKILDYWKNN